MFAECLFLKLFVMCPPAPQLGKCRLFPVRKYAHWGGRPGIPVGMASKQCNVTKHPSERKHVYELVSFLSLHSVSSIRLGGFQYAHWGRNTWEIWSWVVSPVIWSRQVRDARVMPHHNHSSLSWLVLCVLKMCGVVLPFKHTVLQPCGQTLSNRA